MAEACETQASEERIGDGEDPLVVLPGALDRNLRKARSLHNRGMRARYDSNERRKMLAKSQQHIREAMSEAATAGIPLADLPEWSRRTFDPQA